MFWLVEPPQALGYTSALMSRQITAEALRPARGWIVALVDVVAVAGLIALATQIRIPLPWTPVPVTLQTLPVLAAAFVVGRYRATWGVVLYLALGMAGAPVFAVTVGATFGYLLAFLAAPYLVTVFRSPVAGVTVATLVIYAVGMAWLWVWLRVMAPESASSLGGALMMGVIPFVPCDAVKAAMAVVIAKGFESPDHDESVRD
jgi:biotin transport system substrate-specific component